MNKAVFLDRDGVINKAIIKKRKPYPPADLSELVILPGVREAINSFLDANFMIVVVTNQPDVARGLSDKKTVELINSFIGNLLNIDLFKVCYHDSIDNCMCRKPKPGLIINASIEKEIDLSSSFMVGDRWRDIEAGYSAGCKTFFIDNDYNEKKPTLQDHTVSSLLEVKNIIIGTMNE